MTHTYIRPARLSFYSTELATTVRRVYGYQAYCTCDAPFKVWKTHREAELERSFHRCEPRG